MPAKNVTLSNALLNAVLRNTAYTSPSAVYVALFTVAPTSTTGGTEVTGTNYARQAVTFGAPSGGISTNSAPVTFPAAGSGGWGTVVAAAVMDSLSGGAMLYFGTLSASKTVGQNDQLNFTTGALSVTEQ